MFAGGLLVECGARVSYLPDCGEMFCVECNLFCVGLMVRLICVVFVWGVCISICLVCFVLIDLFVVLWLSVWLFAVFNVCKFWVVFVLLCLV